MTGRSRVLADHVPTEDEFVARRLDEAGAVLLGKLSMHEFAWGSPTREGRSRPGATLEPRAGAGPAPAQPGVAVAACAPRRARLRHGGSIRGRPPTAASSA